MRLTSYFDAFADSNDYQLRVYRSTRLIFRFYRAAWNADAV